MEAASRRASGGRGPTWRALTCGGSGRRSPCWSSSWLCGTGVAGFWTGATASCPPQTPAAGPGSARGAAACRRRSWCSATGRGAGRGWGWRAGGGGEAGSRSGAASPWSPACARPPREGSAGRSGRRAERWSGVWSRSRWNTRPVLSLERTKERAKERKKEQNRLLLQLPVKGWKRADQVKERRGGRGGEEGRKTEVRAATQKRGQRKEASMKEKRREEKRKAEPSQVG